MEHKNWEQRFEEWGIAWVDRHPVVAWVVLGLCIASLIFTVIAASYSVAH